MEKVGVLAGFALGSIVDIVLQARRACLELGTPGAEVYLAPELETAGELQILVPPALGTVVMSCEVGGTGIINVGVGLEGKLTVEEAEGRAYIPL